jgi:O-acetylserine/cysteine efflux transporter
MAQRTRLVFPALAAAGILWGTTVPLSKLALAWLAPGWLAFARFALAAALLTVVSRPKLRAACSPAILITGAAGYGGSVLLQNLGVERTSVTHAALLVGATPVLVAVLAAVLGHGAPRPVGWLGIGLSLAGVAIVAAGRGAGSSVAGDGLVLTAQLAAAGFTVSQARLLRGRDPVAVTALQLTAAAAAVLPAALAGGPAQAGPASPAALLATGGLVLAGTVLPTTLFAFAQSRVPAAIAGAFLNLEPLFGAVIGILLFGNPVGPAQVAGGAAVVAGLGLSSCQAVRVGGNDRPGRAGPRLSSRPGLALSGDEPHQRRQPQATRRPADMNGELVPGRNPAGKRLVITSKRPSRNGQPRVSHLVRSSPDDRERCEGADGTPPARRVSRLGHVHLDHLLARSAAAVADAHGQLEIASLAEPRRAVERLTFPGRVPQARPERVARHPTGDVVAAIADQQPLVVVQHAVPRGRGVQDRAVGLGGRHRYRQPATGLCAPEQHVGQRGAELLAGKPRVDDGGRQPAQPTASAQACPS